MTVAELELRMSSRELTEWQGYFRVLHEDRERAPKDR